MAALDVFLKIDGIDGESSDSQHTNEIQVLTHSFSANNQGTANIGGGLTAGKVSFGDFSITCWMSKASVKLFDACARGTSIKSAKLSLRKATGQGGQKDFAVFTFSDLLVSHYSSAVGEEAGLVPVDSITFNFTKLEMKYSVQNADGSLGPEVLAGWDTKKNAAT